MFRLWCSKIPSFRLAGGVSPSLRRPCHLLSSLKPPFRRDRIATTSSWLSSRRLSNVLDPMESELFNYTTGRFLANEALRLRERRRVFDIPGLFRIIAKTLHCKREEIVGFEKLAEGDFYRVFLVTLATGFQLVARIPYPRFFPKGYALASEVATMDFLRSKGLPIPKVYAYSFTLKNEAQTEYILMEYAEGVDLSEEWSELQPDEIISLMEQLATLEGAVMSISFPAGGSIYYAKDLKELSGNEGIPLDEQISTSLERGRFCIGPYLLPSLWYGRREQLNVFRGPYEDAESVLVAGAEKELAYLEQFGSPRLSRERFRRACYNYEKQSPSDHAKNLRRYLRLVPWIVPADHSLNNFCIRHYPKTTSIRISRDSNGLQVLSLLDWHHATVQPLFLRSGTPPFIQNQAEEFLQSTVEPRLPDNFDSLSEAEQDQEVELHRRRFVHYHYIQSTEAYNSTHYKALFYPFSNLRRILFHHSVIWWGGETIELLRALMIMVVYNWEAFAEEGVPCPVVFTDNEVVEAVKLHQAITVADMREMVLAQTVGYRRETWVPAAHYEKAKAFNEEVKRCLLEGPDAKNGEETNPRILENWPLDDVDEQELEEYK